MTANEGTVAISTSTSGAEIYYTTDGETPTIASTKYASPFVFTETGTATVKAIAVKDGLTESEVATATYTIAEKGTPVTPTHLLYESVSSYTGSDGSSEIATNNQNLDYRKWTKFSGIYLGINGCLKLGANSKTGSMTAENIALTGNGTLRFSLKKYGSDTGKLKVTVTGAKANGDTKAIEYTPSDDFVEYTIALTEANGSVSLIFETTSKRAYLDEIILDEDNLEPSGLAYDPNQYTAALGKPFETPVLSNPNNLPVSYASTNEDVATVDASTGEVTLKSVGTTVVSASFAGNETYREGTANYVLTVVDVPAAPEFSIATGTTVYKGRVLSIKAEGASSITYTYNGSEKTVEGSNATQALSAKGEQIVTAYATNVAGESPLTTATYYVVERPEAPVLTTVTVFANQLTVTISSDEANVAFYYTTDESQPTLESTRYESPFTISETTIVKAISAIETVTSSSHSEAKYTKNMPVTTVEKDGWLRINSEEEMKQVCTLGQPVIFTNRVTDGKTDKYVMSATVKSSNNRDGINIGTSYEEGGQVVYLTDEQKSKAAMIYPEYTSGKGFTWYDSSAGGYYQCTLKGSTNEFLCYSDDNENYSEDYTYTDLTFGDDGKEVLLRFNYDSGISHPTIRNLRYNSQNSLFNGYADGTQQGISIYYEGVRQEEALTLDEQLTNSPSIAEKQNTTVSVNLYRALTAGMWNAICLPFDLSDAQLTTLFGEGYRLQEFDNVSEDGGIHLNFKATGALKAGLPYIVKPTQTVEKGALVVLSDVVLTSTEPTVVSHTGSEGDYTYQGIYDPTSLEVGNKQTVFIGAGNKLYWSNSSNPMRAFRGFFTLPTPEAASKLFISVDEDGTPTDISAVGAGGMAVAASAERVYSLTGQLMGQSLKSLPSGVYIVNGRKMIVK